MLRALWCSWLLGLFSAACLGSPAPLRHACAVASPPALNSAAWQVAPGGRVSVTRAELPCWVAVDLPDAAAQAQGRVLSVAELHLLRVVLTAYDASGQRVAWAPRHGTPERAVVTGQRALLMPQLPPGTPLLVKVEPLPGTRDVPGLPTQLVFESVDAAAVMRDEQRFDLVNTATATFLLVAALFALCFAVLLKEADYIVFAVYAVVQVLVVVAKSGLPFVVEHPPAWLYHVSTWQLLLSALSALLYMRLGRFAEHTPWAARAALAVAAGFTVAALAGLVLPWAETVLIQVLLPVHFAVAVWGHWRGWRRGEHVCGVLLVVLAPIIAFWGVYFAHLAVLGRPMPSDLVVGSVIDVVRTLLLPAACIYALAWRTMQARRASSRALREDRLTGLLNREGLREQMSLGIRRGERPALVLLDIERFGPLNQALGGDAGDRLLAGTASRLRGLLEGIPSARVARLHADQFGVLLSSAEISATLKAQVEGFFRQPVLLDGQPVDVALRAGVALLRPGQPDFEVFRDAELALNRARRTRQPWVVFDRELDRRPGADLALLSDLQRAVERDEFELHLQPKVRVSDGRFTGAEALIRWTLPSTGEAVPARRLLDAAADAGLLDEVGAWALREACRRAAAWCAEGCEIPVSVNIAPSQFRRGDLVDQVHLALGEAGLPGRLLSIEVPEGVLASDGDAVAAQLEAVRAAGASVAIDDFGTGIDGIACLHRCGADEVKLDRSVVARLPGSAEDRATLDLVQRHARRLGARCVAEGIERADQWALLSERAWDAAQGWLVSRPIDGADVPAFAHGGAAGIAVRA